MNRISKFYHSLPYYLPTALIIIAVLILTLIPVPQSVVPDVDNFDKIMHALMFGFIAAVTWLDMAHHRHTRPLWSQYLFAAIAASILGGVIELLQGTDFINRSCDLYDFLADTAGAFVLPVFIRPLIWRLLPASQKVELRTVRVPTGELEQVYNESFPTEERREWRNIEERALADNEPLQFTEVLWLGKPVGMISWWNFGTWAYLEHFAVSSSLRGAGIGAVALRKWIELIGTPAVLEVELPDANDMASRRIKFYERIGFHGHADWHYIQPPYYPGLPSVPLMLMTYGNIHNLNDIESVLHKQVYGVKQ